MLLKIILYLLFCVVVYFAAYFIFSRKYKKGCLHGKTDQEKDEFFTSLYNFSITNKQFFQEQYWDLLPVEREEFENWLHLTVENKKQIIAMLNLIEELLCQKDKE